MDFTLENSVANFLKLSGDNFRFQIKKKKKRNSCSLVCIYSKSPQNLYTQKINRKTLKNNHQSLPKVHMEKQIFDYFTVGLY